MGLGRFLMVATVSALAAGCSYTSTTTTVPAASAYPRGAEQACIDYGFRIGTDAYNRCVSREAEARALGRVSATYPVANLSYDARTACASYGLTPGTGAFDRCVNREIEARRYVVVTPATYPAPGAPYVAYPAAPGTTIVTTTSPASATVYVPAAETPPAGVQTMRDEFGFRYDGQGNRLDRNGNVISPQSTTP